jgi:hypothetical protein
LFPGSEILDRDLSIARARIPIVAVDSSGRLILGMFPDTTDADVLAVLDVVALARSHGHAIAQHLDDARVKSRAGISVWVLAPRLDGQFLARLQAMDAKSLRAFEIVVLQSRRGTRQFVTEVPIAKASHGAEPDRSGFSALSRENRALGELVERRVARIDPEIHAVRHAAGVEWSFDTEDLCSLQVRGEALEGRVTDGADPQPVGSVDAVDPFLERVVQRYLALLRVQPLAPATEGLAAMRESILTPEEIAAFDPAR